MNEEKKSLRARVACYCRQPSMSDTLILRGQSCAIVYGCKRILQYTPERICLRVGKQRLSVIGHELICSSFSGGAVTLAGRIEGVFFDALEKEALGKE